MKNKKLLKVLSVAALTLPTLTLAACGATDITDTDYTIKFDSNYDTSIEDMIVENDAESVTLPTPERDGYTFDGWFTDATLETPYVFDVEVDEDVTLYAGWTFAGVTVASASELAEQVLVENNYILLTNDIYLTESLVIANNVFIDGENEDGNYTIYGDEDSASTALSIFVESGDVVFKNLNIKEFGSQGAGATAVVIGTTSNLYTGTATFENCNISEFGKNGISINGSGTLYMTDSTVDAADVREDKNNPRTPNCVQGKYEAELILTNNTFADSLTNNETWAATGVIVLAGATVEAYDNTFDGCNRGVQVDGYYDAYYGWTGKNASAVNVDTIVEDNTFINMDDNVSVYYYNIIEDNVIYVCEKTYYIWVDEVTGIRYRAGTYYSSLEDGDCVSTLAAALDMAGVDTIYVTADSKEAVETEINEGSFDFDGITIIWLEA